LPLCDQKQKTALKISGAKIGLEKGLITLKIAEDTALPDKG
jgi:hypothetical protein